MARMICMVESNCVEMLFCEKHAEIFNLTLDSLIDLD